MMTRGKRLAEAIERSVSGPMWHGPALADLLEGVTPDQAAAKPIAGAHSIWELVLHMTSWTNIVRSRLGPNKAQEPTPDMDFPPIRGTGPDEWRTAIQHLKEAKHGLAADVAELRDDDFKRIVPGRDHSVAVMLHGLIEHDVYHGGQIAILKKALA